MAQRQCGLLVTDGDGNHGYVGVISVFPNAPGFGRRGNPSGRVPTRSVGPSSTDTEVLVPLPTQTSTGRRSRSERGRATQTKTSRLVSYTGRRRTTVTSLQSGPRRASLRPARRTTDRPLPHPFQGFLSRLDARLIRSRYKCCRRAGVVKASNAKVRLSE